nr:alkaline phosphatase family protein [Luteibacter pinisoli]
MNATFPRLPRLFTAFFLLVLAGCATHPAQTTTKAPDPVLLVSIDAFRADYVERHLTPTLQAMSDEGAHAPYMWPSFPSLTFPNHYTLVTGRVPDRNGIVNNTMRDPALGRFSLATTRRPAMAAGGPRPNRSG